MKARLIQKLKSTQGFMLAEQLVSIIFIGLLGIAIAAGIGAAMSAFANVTKSTESLALLNRAVQEVSDEFAFSRDVNGIEYVSPTVSARVQLVDAADNRGIALQGNGISTGDPTKGPQPEQVLLIPAMDGMVPTISGITYSNNIWTFTITINNNGNQEATSTMSVARVGN